MLAAVWPMPLAGHPAGAVLGGACAAAGIALVAWCKRTLAAAGTPLPGGLPTTAIVQSGPYRLSRNPIYVGFALVHLGVALAADSPWILGSLGAAMLAVGGIVVPREERYLARKFGGEYLAYKAAVRRWV